VDIEKLLVALYNKLTGLGKRNEGIPQATWQAFLEEMDLCVSHCCPLGPSLAYVGP
jgi:hypothetical protein